MPVITSLQDLKKEDLIRILVEPKNALTKQYEALLAMDNVELEINKDAVEAIAEKALVRKTGARGLRGIMEKIMNDIMYELPSRSDVTKCIITRETVEAEQEPQLITMDNRLSAGENSDAETA
jgi:ATP-dependent Clp protease ATP-binding subunit ClpX